MLVFYITILIIALIDISNLVINYLTLNIGIVGIHYLFYKISIVNYRKKGILTWFQALLLSISFPIILVISIWKIDSEQLIKNIMFIYIMSLGLFTYFGGIDRIRIWRNRRKSKKQNMKSDNQKELNTKNH